MWPESYVAMAGSCSSNLIRPLSWEQPYAIGVALKSQKKKKKKKERKRKEKKSIPEYLKNLVSLPLKRRDYSRYNIGQSLSF